MPTSDLPIVDENSKSSEESVLAVKGFFSKRNGFIAREEIPDYGCDLDVELILDDTNASSKKFPIQIKSSQKFNEIIIEGEVYLSKSFSTTSLQYLCERSPAYGLIIFYDDLNKICHFDYVEKIVDRLNIDRGGEAGWLNQKSVTIHIPKNNVVSSETILNIHNVFLNRFKAHTILLQLHGEEFNIPSLSKEEDIIDKKLSSVQLLHKYGLAILDEYHITALYQLIITSPSNEIITSKELTFIACVVYSEMGMCIEAEFYFRKAQLFKDNFNSQENEVLTFSRIKVDFLLGKRSKQDFFNDIKALSNSSSNIYNKLQLQINLFHYTVIEQIDKNEYNDNTEKEMVSLFETIDVSILPQNKKWLLKTYQAMTLHMYISSLVLTKISRLRVREALLEDIPPEESHNLLKKANSIIHLVTTIALGALKYGVDEKDELLQAHAYYTLGRFFFIREFHFLLLHFKYTGADLEENYKRTFHQLVVAHNFFSELSMIQDARAALIDARDLHRLAKLYHDIEISFEPEQEKLIIDKIRNYELEMGIDISNDSIIDPAYNSYLKSNSFNVKEHTSVMSEEDIVLHSKIALDSYGLPEDRMQNMINELKAYKFFYSNYKADRFELLVNLKHLSSQAEKYKFPSSFTIVDTITGIESSSSTDIKELMESLDLLT